MVIPYSHSFPHDIPMIFPQFSIDFPIFWPFSLSPGGLLGMPGAKSGASAASGPAATVEGTEQAEVAQQLTGEGAKGWKVGGPGWEFAKLV